MAVGATGQGHVAEVRWVGGDRGVALSQSTPFHSVSLTHKL